MLRRKQNAALSTLLPKSVSWALVVLTASLLTSGCASPNPFASHFEAGTTSSFPPKKVAPKLYRRSDPASLLATFKDLGRQGYWAMGISTFRSTSIDAPRLAMAHAKSIGADAVVYMEAFHSSVAGTQTVLDYIPGTSSTRTTSGMANATATGTASYTGPYGARGYGSASGSATGSYQETQTTSTPGTFTTHQEPAIFNVFDYRAIFLRYAPEQRGPE